MAYTTQELRNKNKNKKIKVTTTGSSKVLSSNNAIVTHKSSRADNPNQRKGTTNPNTNPTAPTIANLANNNAVSSNSPVNVPPSGGEVPTSASASSSPSEPLTNGFGGGGSGGASTFGERFTGGMYEAGTTIGEALKEEWEYVKPTAALALWEAGAAELILGKASQLVKKIFSKYAPKKTISFAQEELQRTGMPAITEKGGKIVAAANSKTGFKYKKLLIKAGFNLGTTAIITSLTGKVFSEFQLAEATDKIGYARTRAVELGDMESVAELDNMMEEILDQSKWQEFASYVPFVGAITGVKQNLEAARLANEVYKRLDQYKMSGMSPVQDYEASRQERIADEAAMIDYFNEQRRIAQENARIAEINARNEDAAFWKKYKKELYEMEREQAKKIADFWLEYARKKAEYERESNETYSPKSDEAPYSKLSFGLL